MLVHIFFLQALAVLCANGDTGCKYSTPVEAFVAAVRAAVIVTSNVGDISVPGANASVYMHDALLGVLEKRNYQCGAEWEAFAAGSALKSAGTYSRNEYLTDSGRNTALYLLEVGLLHCGNAVSLALDFFRYVRHALKGLDLTSLKSYMVVMMAAKGDFLEAHKFVLEEFTQKLVDSFHQQKSKEFQDTCSVH